MTIDSSGWAHGPSYVNNACYGVGGTLRSALSQPLYDIVLEAHIYDPTGQLLTTATGATRLHMTLPDRPNAFLIPIDFGVCNLNPTFELVVKRVHLTPPRAYQPITVVAFQGCRHADGSPARRTVTLRNDNHVAVSDVQVTLQYDASSYGTQLAAAGSRRARRWCTSHMKIVLCRNMGIRRRRSVPKAWPFRSHILRAKW